MIVMKITSRTRSMSINGVTLISDFVRVRAVFFIEASDVKDAGVQKMFPRVLKSTACVFVIP